MYEILVAREAEKCYKKGDRDTKRRLNKCLDVLEPDSPVRSQYKETSRQT